MNFDFLSQLRIVTVYPIDSGRPSEFIVPVDDVSKFVEATKKLHMNPGVDPHNGNPTTPAHMITVAELRVCGPYWWTTPDLQNNDDPNGARIIQKMSETVVAGFEDD